ncbi:MAG: phosphatase PAP2 family protein [Pseudomonadota bacterium]
MFFVVAVSGVAISFVKNTIGRARPRHLDTLGPYHFEIAAFESGFASFPSGHSTTFGAFAAAMALLFPRTAIVMLPLGLLGGFSRVVVGAHWLSDVMAGLACGALFALLVARYLANRGIMFSLAEGAVLPRRIGREG